MANTPRYLPPGEQLVEITCRTQHGRCLLRPDRILVQILLGVLARALHRYDLRLCAAVFLSNHYHLLLRVDGVHKLTDFMRFLNSQLSTKIGKHIGWSGGIWQQRFHMALVSPEPEAQKARLRYLLAHGCKEGLVLKIRHWPGLHSGPALMGDGRLVAHWRNDSRRCHDRHHAGEKADQAYLEPEILEHAPLPCWDHLSAKARRRKVRRMVGEIEREAEDRRRFLPGGPLDAAAILAQDPFQRIPLAARRPAPRIHAARRTVRERYLEAYRAFLDAYRRASARYRDGDPNAQFPPGCFKPPGPFVAPATA